MKGFIPIFFSFLISPSPFSPVTLLKHKPEKTKQEKIAPFTYFLKNKQQQRKKKKKIMAMVENGGVGSSQNFETPSQESSNGHD